jgi:hypothetical protein
MKEFLVKAKTVQSNKIIIGYYINMEGIHIVYEPSTKLMLEVYPNVQKYVETVLGEDFFDGDIVEYKHQEESETKKGIMWTTFNDPDRYGIYEEEYRMDLMINVWEMEWIESIKLIHNENLER